MEAGAGRCGKFQKAGRYVPRGRSRTRYRGGVEALAPALDALSLGIEAARTSPDAKDPRIVSHLEGLDNIHTAFETGLKALGVRTIAPKDTPFDPALHEAMQTQETDTAKPGQVMVLHRPGFAIGQRLIRPARVTLSAAPGKTAEE